MKLIFVGPPGAGKGTLSERVVEKYGLAHISTGDMLREQIAAGTGLGNMAKGYIDKGQLVPDDVIIGMVGERLKQPDCEKGYILDGFPRTAEQARALDALTDIDACVEIAASDDSVVERISGRRVCKKCGYVTHVSYMEGDDCPKCGGEFYVRPDDSEETTRSRLEVYHTQTAPLISHYEAMGKLKRLDAEGAAKEQVFERFVKIAEEL